MGKIIGLAVLIFDVIAVLDCLKSNLSSGKKVLWIILIIVFPFLGMILYYLVGKNSK